MNSVERVSANTVAVFTFGRFQPPTIGHKLLIDAVASESASLGADGYIFVSSSQNDLTKYQRSIRYRNMMSRGAFNSIDLNENPLDVTTKIKFLKKMYPETSIKFINTTECPPAPVGLNPGCKKLFEIITKLKVAGYNRIIMVAGSDRAADYESRISKYHPDIEYKSLERLKRNPNNTSNIKPEEMSGTLVRKAAASGKLEAFSKGVKIGSMTDEDVKELFNEVRKGLALVMMGGKRKRKTCRKNLHPRESIKIS